MLLFVSAIIVFLDGYIPFPLPTCQGDDDCFSGLDLHRHQYDVYQRLFYPSVEGRNFISLNGLKKKKLK
jgi:hypothetical protein